MTLITRGKYIALLLTSLPVTVIWPFYFWCSIGFPWNNAILYSFWRSFLPHPRSRSLHSLRTDGDICHQGWYTEIAPKMSKPTDTTIHWKALVERFLIITISFIIEIYFGENTHVLKFSQNNYSSSFSESLHVIFSQPGICLEISVEDFPH
jgi:hypothetical protein